MLNRRLLLIAMASSVFACNDGALTSAPIAPCVDPSANPIAIKPSEQSLATRKAGAYRPNEQTGDHEVATSAISANDLLAAMDVDLGLVTARSLTGDLSQSAAFTDLGSISPTEGSKMAWLSTGVAGAGTPRTLDPSADSTQEGTDFFGMCPGSLFEYFDCVTLQFTFTVPSGMNSLRFDFNFLSVEFPEYVNLGYNDTFEVSMSSPSNSYANLVFDTNGNPIGIDSAFFNETCENLVGTGFDLGAAEGFCDAGATGLLSTIAPVTPGEDVTLTFTLKDSGDGVYDSAVMLDNLQTQAGAIEEPETNPCD